MLKYYISFLLLSCFWQSVIARSCLRPRDPYVPCITVQKESKGKIYFLQDSHLEVSTIFYTFDETYLRSRVLPSGPITFRNNPKKYINGHHLSMLIEELVKEIQAKKRVFKHFTILKDEGFNTRKQAGLLVLKVKNYPFVVKLFMETPRAFVRPYNKGFITSCHFIVGGGATRHILGFTRLANRDTVEQMIESSDEWKGKVELPRKWSWFPKHEEWLMVTGYNIGGHETIQVKLPAIYAIVADAIEQERTFSMRKGDDTKTAIKLSNFLDFRIDAHLNNFMIEKHTGKIIIIDTEHFPTMVGCKERPQIHSYVGFYWNLFKKGIKDTLFRSKRERRRVQSNPQPPFSIP